MPDTYLAVARRSCVQAGLPRVERTVVGLYATRPEAEDACRAFLSATDTTFRRAYDDCIVELAIDSVERSAAPS